MDTKIIFSRKSACVQCFSSVIVTDFEFWNIISYFSCTCALGWSDIALIAIYKKKWEEGNMKELRVKELKKCDVLCDDVCEYIIRKYL